MARGSIKTAYIGGFVNGLTVLTSAVTVSAVVAAWLCQDRIRIVGVEVGTYGDINDASSNTDGHLRAHHQVSRSGLLDNDSCLLEAGTQAVWNGVIAVGDTRAEKTINFPDGTGVDVDAGESINLLVSATWIGSGTVNLRGYGIIHYIER